MGNKAQNELVAVEALEAWDLRGRVALLHWIAVICAVASLVFSLFPWTLTPAWLMELDDLTSTRSLALDVTSDYGPMGYADLATTFNSVFDAGSVVWVLGAAEALWVAALTFIALATGGSLARKPFDLQQLRRFLAWGSGAVIIAAVLTIIFLAISGGALAEYFAGAPSSIAGYVAYVGGAAVTSQGFGAAPWLWFSLVLGIVAFGCAIAESALVSRSFANR